MMAEHTNVNECVVREVTVHRRGTLASFFRRIEDALSTLRRFLERTARDYRRFNYIGEWHSHPSLAPIPSARDHESMREIIRDPDVGAHFVALLIVKLASDGELIGTALVYQPDGVLKVAMLGFE